MDVETVTRQILLDGVLIPRANGSDGLERVDIRARCAPG